VGVAEPARADNAEAVVIVVAAAAAAAIAVVATVTIVQGKRKKIAITGRVLSGGEGLTIADEEDRETYLLSDETSGVKAGNRMKLEGKRVRTRGPDKTRVWETKRVIKDFGVCP
jgi:hypothetical protein